MPKSGGISDDTGKILALEDLIAVIDRHEKTPSNVPKVDTFHFNGERVSDWLDRVKQAMVGLSDAVKFQRIMRYVLYGHHQEVQRVVSDANGDWARFSEGMQRKYRLGDDLLTTGDLEAMNNGNFTTIGAFVHEFKKRARKVHGISEETQCAIFLGLLTASGAQELTSHGGGSTKLTWATIHKGVEDRSLDQVEQHQVRLQRQKRKERDATASGTLGVRKIITDILTELDPVIQRKVAATIQGKAKEPVIEEAAQEGWEKEETVPPHLSKMQRKQRNLTQGGQGSGRGQMPQAVVAASPSASAPSSSAGKRKKTVEVEDDDDEEEEDERLRQEEDQRAELRAKKREAREETEPVLRDMPPRKKKYAVRLEEGFDVEKVIDRLLEGHNDLMTLKEILASAPKLRDGLKGRLSRRLVPNVHRGTILPKEAEWAESGTKMDWKCMACGTVDLVVKGSKCTAMVDIGAKMNIIQEADAIKFGLDIDRSDYDILHGASCRAVFCGTTSNVFIEVGKVKVRACFFVMPDVDHGILLGRSFLSRTETVIFNKHNGTLILLLCDPACGNYEVITCRNTGPKSIRNRPNPGSFTIEESEGERRRLRTEPEEEARVEAFSLSLSDVGKAMDFVAAHEMADLDAIQALREQIQRCQVVTYIWMFNFELERIPGSKNRADGLSRINWDGKKGEAVENTPPVDGFLDQEEDVRLHINKWSPRVPSCVGHPIWQTPCEYERKAKLVLKPFEEEDPWGGKDVQWMMELALARSHNLVEDMRAIEEGSDQVERHEELMGGMYLLVNMLLQESLDQAGSLNPAGNEDEVPESHDDEFEEGEIKEAFRAEEYEGIYLELGLLLSCEVRLRDASDKAQRMMQRYLVRDGHLFVRREVRNPRRVVCGRNRQIDVMAALHDGIAGGHRGVQATYAKISELYYWDGMMDMIGKFCRSWKEVIEVGKDTPPRTPAVGLRLGDTLGSTRQEEGGLQREEAPLPSSEKAPSPERRAERRRETAAVRREALALIDRHLAAHALEHPDLEEPAPAEPRQEPCQPEKEVEAEIPKRVDLRTRERAPTGETAEEKRARRSRRIEEIWQERQRLEAAGALSEQQQEKQKLEAEGTLPDQPPNAPPKAPEIPEMWRDFWEQRGEELPSPTRVGFGVARKAEERLDRKIRFLTKTTFDRYLLLESDLAGKKMKVESHGLRLETMEVEIQELGTLVASQAAIIEGLRQQLRGGADKAESNRQGEQRQPGQGSPGQPSAAEPCQEPPMGKVILEPEEARAQREEEREAFEFRAPT
ncbi:hypothetical protein CBR_g31449 [Chara braunii]|uniref:Integrase zinc-binding domain-containing protein n=1 Tax=Chara braunii TaxID=69332 RepID=A0A388LF97_CHABU|nr:hypothetical protein CBR_g31449 [Chara braunii]|eukprot:GBG80893.1 hypothetical protein CBR_g31449 [Chara braunii]